MLAVSASRHGLLLTIWAKPTLYLSFFFKGGTWPKAGIIARPAAAPTDPMSACLRVMSIAFPPSCSRTPRGPMTAHWPVGCRLFRASRAAALLEPARLQNDNNLLKLV